MDSSQNVQLHLCIFQDEKKHFKFISTSGPDFYRVTIDCDKTSILKTRDPETSVLVELSKSSCGIPPDESRPHWFKGHLVNVTRQVLTFSKLADTYPSGSSWGRTSDHKHCWSQSHRTLFQAAEALTWSHILKCCLKDTWTTHKHILPEQRPGSPISIRRDCIWFTNFSAFNLYLFKG